MFIKLVKLNIECFSESQKFRFLSGHDHTTDHRPDQTTTRHEMRCDDAMRCDGGETCAVRFDVVYDMVTVFLSR